MESIFNVDLLLGSKKLYTTTNRTYSSLLKYKKRGFILGKYKTLSGSRQYIKLLKPTCQPCSLHQLVRSVTIC